MDLSFLSGEIAALKEKGRYRSLRRVSGPQDAVIRIEGADRLNFSSNNYLGLANHPAVVAAFVEHAGRYGVGSGASRLICGHMEVHAELEDAVARLKGTEAALTFSAGYMANLGILSTLAGPDATIFSDELNHASIVDGCRLARARVEVYRHSDATHLSDLLGQSRAKRKIVVTDGVFSMDGDIAPLPDLVEAKERHGAILVVDDAHATGVLPPHGRGTAGHFGIRDRVEIQMGTFSKALGTYGAYIGTTRAMVDYFINKCRPFIFNTGLPPAIAGATLAALHILSGDPELLSSLWRNQVAFRAEMAARGRAVTSPTAIVPIPVGGDVETMEVSKTLFDRGVFVHGIRPPTVPEGTGRLRLTLMATHTREMIRTAAEQIDRALSEQGIGPDGIAQA
ncbi:MAG: 8-amino-7-oxononanoate synthase [Deltaproteobacteria bacterium RBG_16_64_85]|nr:MAG: 8-amino-7-oxononanoate synthase [Deltaproteobacteria bacterium RBG_16_64_85]